LRRIWPSSGPGDGEPRRRCLAYLVAQQRDDGSFLSPPDQAGPRPLPYDVPVLASIFALLALGHDPNAGMATTISKRVPELVT
jgi:squalene-hopene/tetraprenyl-beta-curcumene cyclase/sporulenol synthase